ncbi:MAG: anthranilate synthase component I [Deltaproteobacteria bacterium]|nr:anthranilate synthase component I [Deltaproteobacteria bacterium]MBI3389585.1 anthranilate synthase component I [Deltaproteobacteria bacterium]
MYTPEFDEFCRLAEQGNLVPVYREILADLETPVSAFLKIDEGGDAFLLESVEGNEKWARYSFLGAAPELIVRSKGTRLTFERAGQPPEEREVADPLSAVRDLLAQYRAVAVKGLPRFSGGFVGYLGYDVVRFIEHLPECAADDLAMPDLYLLLADTLLIFDNVAQKIKVVSHAHLTPGSGRDALRAAYDAAGAKVERVIARLQKAVEAPRSLALREPGPVGSNLTQEQYETMVRRAKEYIVAGDVIQVVLAQRFECPLRAHPFNIYRCLRTVNPSPYMFFLRMGPHTLLGSSPEVMVRLEGREVTVRPIAGTRPRGTEEKQDSQFEQELMTDPKEIAEHIMLLDLGRNDVGRVAKIGSVAVTEHMVVERYAYVMHLVSNVRGDLRAELDCFDAFRATFPAGTLSGAPKVRAMELIEELEPVRRGIYGGAVGYFDFSGNMDTCITIRSLLVAGNTVYIGAGAGIVADSDPEREHAECVNKARALIHAVRLAEAM